MCIYPYQSVCRYLYSYPKSASCPRLLHGETRLRVSVSISMYIYISICVSISRCKYTSIHVYIYLSICRAQVILGCGKAKRVYEFHWKGELYIYIYI